MQEFRGLKNRIRAWFARRITGRFPEETRATPPAGVRRRAARDRRRNAAFPEIREYIGLQGGGGKADRLHFGPARMSFCGCEVIAAYNARLALGAWQDVRQVASELYARGAVLGGLLGVRPDAVAAYFVRYGFPVRFEVFSRKGRDAAGMPGDAGHAIPEGHVELLTFWNSPKAWTIHTVMIRPEESGGFRVYNMHSDALSTVYASYESILRSPGREIVPIARITVGPGEAPPELREAGQDHPGAGA